MFEQKQISIVKQLQAATLITLIEFKTAQIIVKCVIMTELEWQRFETQQLRKYFENLRRIPEPQIFAASKYFCVKSFHSIRSNFIFEVDLLMIHFLVSNPIKYASKNSFFYLMTCCFVKKKIYI